MRMRVNTPRTALDALGARPPPHAYLHTCCRASPLSRSCHASGAAVLDDKELFEERYPFTPEDLAELARYLNRVAYTLVWVHHDEAGFVSPPSSTSSSTSSTSAVEAKGRRAELRDASLRLLGLLADRDARRPFCPPGLWLIDEIRYSEIHRELGENRPRAKRLLASMPWAIPFERRVNLFRDLVRDEKARLPNESLPEHLRGHRIKVRRESLLEDGYVQMGGLQAEQLKGTIRVEFINSYGLAEAGIDRTGVFKEFMEDAIANAFDPNRGLFRTTPRQQIFPSPASADADPQHLRLFEFIGRMLGKAIYEVAPRRAAPLSGQRPHAASAVHVPILHPTVIRPHPLSRRASCLSCRSPSFSSPSCSASTPTSTSSAPWTASSRTISTS